MKLNSGLISKRIVSPHQQFFLFCMSQLMLDYFFSYIFFLFLIFIIIIYHVCLLCFFFVFLLKILTPVY